MGKSGSKLKAGLLSLGGWFERQKRVLPWRDDPTLYRVWVSEIMLQQTQVATVIPYFERFMGRFPTVQSLAEASEEEVMRYWAGLGYYSRARNLRRGAQIIVQERKGVFPKTRDEWLEVPGVGGYTAGAILSIALNQAEAILDGNVERVISRLERLGRQQGDAAFKTRLWELSKGFVVLGAEIGIKPSVLNQGLMELGATLCTPKKPRCGVCPVKTICDARASGDPESFPPKKKPKEWIQVKEELHCVLDESGHILLRQRASGEWRAGLWDLLEKKPRGALALGKVETKHVVTRHKITRITHVWRSAWSASEKKENTARWISVNDPEVPVGSALKRTLARIHEKFPEAWRQN